MNKQDNLDLNLLTYLEVLIEEGNVSRAARRVNLSQPAMSLALKRMRILFDDPLLVPTRNKMVPTARALQLIAPIREILRKSDELLRPIGVFEPGECTDRFVVVIPNFLAHSHLPHVVRRFETEAPNASLVVKSAAHYFGKDWFDDKSVDIGVSYVEKSYVESLPESLHAATLQIDRLVCIARKGHPLIDGSITLDILCNTPFVRVRYNVPTFASFVDEALALEGMQLRNGLLLSDFIMVPEIVSTTDMISIVPLHFIRGSTLCSKLQAVPIPLALNGLHLSLTWHSRTNDDPSRQWLRQLFLDEFYAGEN